MPTRTRKSASKSTPVTTDREVSLKSVDMDQVQPNAGFAVGEDGKLHGSADTRMRIGPYGASDAIRRGAADVLKMQLADAPPESRSCICGCGIKPSNPTSLFAPGHDSKVRKMGLAVLRGEVKRSQLSKSQDAYLTTSGFWERASHGGARSHVADELRA